MNDSKEKIFEKWTIPEGYCAEEFEKYVFDYVLGKISTRTITNLYTDLTGFGDSKDETSLNERSTYMIEEVVRVLTEYQLSLIPAYGIACNAEIDKLIASKDFDESNLYVKDIEDISERLNTNAKNTLIAYFRPGFNSSYTDEEMKNLVDYQFIDEFIAMISSTRSQIINAKDDLEYCGNEDDWEDDEENKEEDEDPPSMEELDMVRALLFNSLPTDTDDEEEEEKTDV